MKIDRDLLHKYDRPGPRYTSYPTVPVWTDKFGPDDYGAALRRAATENRPLSMYVHIPFCRSRCFYCGCNTCVEHNSEMIDDYLDAVDRELKMVRGHLGSRNKLNQLHWGGGTPTYLEIERLRRLFNSITDNFEIEKDAEVAIEVDPRVTTAEQIDLLHELGFNRMSFGVQDFNPEVQKAIGRRQTLEQTETLFNYCRRKAFESINVDLIYGLPLQTVDAFAETIAEVIRLKADRVAVYSFAFLPQRLKHQENIKPEQLPGTNEKYNLFATAVEKFTDVGYVQIGMDHFARPNDTLAKARLDGTLYRNFMGYTAKRAGDAVGVGMSAISEIGGCFAQNHSVLETYMKTIAEDSLAAFKGWRLSDDDKIRQFVILELMCNFRLNYEDLNKIFGVDFVEYFKEEKNNLAGLESDGLIELDDKGITVMPAGTVLVRNIAMEFDAYLKAPNKGGLPQFSRTV